MSYFADGQIRRFLVQFAALCSDFNVQYGTDSKGNPILHRVPVIYGDMSRQAAAIINNNSASTLPSAPLMSYYISGLEYDQSRTQDPHFVDKMNVRQRTYNPVTGQYENTQGNAFTVERLMPVPYTLRLTLDIWTNSTQQKLDLTEQFLVLFNPSFEIQSTDNFIDWTSLSAVYQDGITWSSRTVPQGSANTLDIMTVKFYMPIWLSSPVKVKKMNSIHKVIASIHSSTAVDEMWNQSLSIGTRVKVTPYGYKLLYVGNKLQVLPSQAVFNPPEDSFDLPLVGPDTDIVWRSFLEVYGAVQPGVSMISLENQYLSSDIVGTIDYDPTDGRLLIFNVDSDTLPANTMLPVDSIIDPDVKSPGNGLPAAAVGQRYLIVSDIPYQRQHLGGDPVWLGLTGGARSGGIIEFISFSASALTKLIADRPSGAVAGATVITLSDTVNIVVGINVRLGGAIIGSVAAVDHASNTVTLDTPLSSNLSFNTPISFEGSLWVVVFESATSSSIEYVTNTTSGIQYRHADGGWAKAFENFYEAGDWRITV